MIPNGSTRRMNRQSDGTAAWRDHVAEQVTISDFARKDCAGDAVRSIVRARDSSSKRSRHFERLSTTRLALPITVRSIDSGSTTWMRALTPTRDLM